MNTTLAFRAWAPGLVPSAAVVASYELQPLSPTATPGAGAYTSAQVVTLQGDAGSTVRYTVDGSTPTSTSPVYTNPIPVDAPATLSSRAFRAGWTPSTTAVQTFAFQLLPPSLVPGGGVIAPGETVALSAQPGSTMHFTLDGTTPTSASATYTTPLTLASSLTLRAIATRATWLDSEVSSGVYVKTPVISTVSPASGTTGTLVTVSGIDFGSVPSGGILWIGTLPADIVSWMNTQIVATVASGANSGPVEVRLPSVTSNAMAFTVTAPAPHITAVSPSSGAAGTTVTITGTAFGTGQGSGQLWLGTAAGNPARWTDTQITATVASNSRTGLVQVLQNGVWSNGVPFTVTNVAPRVDGVTPTSASPGTPITVWGSGFSDNEGVGVLSVGGAIANVTSWSDNVLVATVPTGAMTGSVKVRQAGQWSNAVPFWLSDGFQQLTLQPNLLSMLVGETRNIQSLDETGAAATGLFWASSAPAVIALSSDDPPRLTALSEGEATITAGGASAEVSVYAGAFPEGTVLWSDSGNSSGVEEIVVAVPAMDDSGTDVFAIRGDASVQALRSDGTARWTANLAANAGNTFQGDYEGGLIVANSMSIERLSPATGQRSSLFSAVTSESQQWGIASPAIHPDGTVFTVDYACHDLCDSADSTDGAWVVGLDMATGAEKLRVPLQNWTFTSTVSDAAFCQSSSPGTNTWRYHSWPFSQLRIAGDGFLYASYATVQSIGTVQRGSVQPFGDAEYGLWTALLGATSASEFESAIGFLDALGSAIGTSATSSAVSGLRTALQAGNRTAAISYENDMAPWFERPCDRTDSTVRQLHLLRVGTDGSSSDVVAQEWAETGTTVYSLAEGWQPGDVLAAGATPYHVTETHTGSEDITLHSHAITNADQGALYSWQAVHGCYASGTTGARTYIQIDPCPTEPENNLTVTSGGAVTSSVVWNPGAGAFAPAEPLVQLENDDFAGEIQPVGGGTPTLLVFGATGEIRWVKPNASPEMALPGGGLLVAEGATHETYSSTGVIVGRTPPLPIQSWFGNSYVHGSVSRLFNTSTLASSLSFWAQPGGNPAGTGARSPSDNLIAAGLAALKRTWARSYYGLFENGGLICRTENGKFLFGGPATQQDPGAVEPADVAPCRSRETAVGNYHGHLKSGERWPSGTQVPTMLRTDINKANQSPGLVFFASTGAYIPEPSTSPRCPDVVGCVATLPLVRDATFRVTEGISFYMYQGPDALQGDYLKVDFVDRSGATGWYKFPVQ